MQQVSMKLDQIDRIISALYSALGDLAEEEFEACENAVVRAGIGGGLWHTNNIMNYNESISSADAEG